MSIAKLKKINNTNYGYVNINNKEFQKNIYERYFYYKEPKQKKIDTYKDLKNYRELKCFSKMSLFNHQAFLKNFISPNTPYTGLLLLHGTGTGKTCSAVAIAENFKYLVKKYNTKIYILVPGPLLKEQWKNEIVFCTGNEYLNNQNTIDNDNNNNTDNTEYLINRNVNSVYKILSYKGFHKRVLGEKIKMDKSNKKSEIKREFSIDKIDNLDNTLLIIDEAHHITKNEWGDALMKIRKKSKNLRILLLSATPMKNLADEIIDILNFLRPLNDPIKRELVFTKEKGFKMEFTKGGDEYLKKMASGYISYYRGNDPLLFAKQKDYGEIPKFLKFTSIIKCQMTSLQLATYKIADKETKDSFERKTQSCSLFTLPGLDSNGKIKGFYGIEGMKKVLSQIRDVGNKLNKKVNKTIFKKKEKNFEDIIYEDSDNKKISGLIFNQKYLKHFSIKYYECLKNINKLVEGKKESGTGFIYCNLVTTGIELFQQVLLNNGYLEYDEKQNYNILDDTIDYKTGLTFKDFNKKFKKKKFIPATFIRVTGNIDETGNEDIPEIKQKIIKNIFNSVENKDGRFIKFIIGSAVMNEGITLENIKEVHILDVWHNLGRIKQIIGRAIRWCKHVRVATKDNPYPTVGVYKYVASVGKKLSSDESLYQKGEYKYVLTKKVENELRKVAIDCPLNHTKNVFEQELKKYKGCKELEISDFKKKAKHKFCPAICDFKNCKYKCSNKSLNLDYYDNNSNLYKNISDKKINRTLFINDLLMTMSNQIKELILNMYRRNYVYTFKQIQNYVINGLKSSQKRMYDKFFLYKALTDMIPITENDFNNFTDVIYDKYNIAGYLIYRDIFYIFQPYKEDTNITIDYRRNFELDINKELNLFKLDELLKEQIKKDIIHKKKIKKIKYNFDDTDYYYDGKEENIFIGIFDKNKKQNVFKIRKKKLKTSKKRETGLQSNLGAICTTAYEKRDLIKIAKKLNIKTSKENKKTTICDQIMKKLLFEEKYQKGKNKKVYILVPINHNTHEFPLNLEDRIEYIQNKIKETIKNIKYTITEENNGILLGIRNRQYIRYKMTIDKEKLSQEDDFLQSLKFKKINDNKYEKIIE
jgi:hypothetical protein